MAKRDVSEQELASFGMQGGDPFMQVVDKAHEELKAKAVEEEPEDEEEAEEEEDDDTGRSGGDDSGDDDDFESEEPEDEDEDDDDDDFDSDDDSEGDDDDFEDGSDEEEEEEPQPIKAKAYRLTSPDGEQVKVKDDHTIKIKSNGKFERVKLSELIEDRGARVKSDELRRRESEEVKRLREINQQKEKRERSLAKEFRTFSSEITKGNLIGALGAIRKVQALESGEHVTDEELGKFLVDSLNGMTKGVQEVLAKDPEALQREVDAYNAERRLEHIKSETEELEKGRATERAIREKQRVAKELNISEGDMKHAFDVLMERNKELQQAGRKPIDFNMQDIGQLVVDSILNENFKALAKASNIELEKEDLQRLLKIGQVERERNKNKDLTEKQYRRILKNYANKEVKAISRNLGDSPDSLASNNARSGSSRKSNPKRQRVKKKTGKLKEITRVSEAWPF